MPAKIKAVTGSRTSKGSLFKVNPENLSNHGAKNSSTPWDGDRCWCLQCLLTREGWGLLPKEVLPLINQIRTWRRINLCIGLCHHLTTWSFIECWSGDRWHVTGNRWNVNISQYFCLLLVNYLHTLINIWIFLFTRILLYSAHNQDKIIQIFIYYNFKKWLAFNFFLGCFGY